MKVMIQWLSTPSLVFLISFCLLPSQLQATKIVWLNLAPFFTYKDVSKVCSAGPSSLATGQLFFSAEVTDGNIKRAALKDNSIAAITDRIFFDNDELKGIEFFRDKRERFWLKTLPLTARLLNWIFFNADSGSTSECKLPQPLLSITPAPYSFDFDVEGLWESLSFSSSPMEKFGGRRKDGATYSVSLRFVQEQFASTENYRSNKIDSSDIHAREKYETFDR